MSTIDIKIQSIEVKHWGTFDDGFAFAANISLNLTGTELDYAAVVEAIQQRIHGASK